MRGATRVLLAADGRSPALARRHLRAACAETGLSALLDDALLLVTELVTNAVVHAGTAVELHIDTTGAGLRVEVVDSSPGGLPLPQRTVEDNREGGRGLLLLDALSSAWGSTHTATGKSLWFRLGALEPATPTRDAGDAPPARLLGLPDLRWLLEVGEDRPELSSDQVVRELLHRMAEGVGVSDVLLVRPSVDGAWEVTQSVGRAPEHLELEQVRRTATGGVRKAALGDALVLPLGQVSRPTGAVVLLDASGLDAERAALARLAADRLSHLLQDESARHALLHDRGALTLLAEASEMFAGALDVTLATTLLCQLVVPRFGSWSAVYGTSGERAQLISVSHLDEERIAELRVRLSTPLAQAAAARLAEQGADARPVVLTADDLPPGLLAADQAGVLAVPLTARRRVLGVLLVARAGASRHTADDVGLLVDLARRAALAVEGARLYEERSAVAQALQASLLPPTLPDVDGLQLGARYAAAGEGNEVGGDFYDVFPVRGGGWAVAIGDVCGKGPEAATITGLARNVLRLMVEDGRPPEEAFRRLNQAIIDLGDRGRFLTTTLALLEPYDGGIRVVLATAGHPPPAVVGRDGQVRFVGGGGTLLGVTPEIHVGLERLTLELGEQLVLYTDGVTERRDQDRWFGEGALSAALAQAHGRSADAVAGHVEQRVRAFGPTAASDDLAVLVVAAVPRTAPAQRAQPVIAAV